MLVIAFLRLVIAALYQNIDNFALAAAYRIKNVTIPLRANLLIGMLSGLATGLAVVIGNASGRAIDFRLGASISEKTGRGLLLMIGVWVLVGYFRKKIFPRLREDLQPGSACSPIRGEQENSPAHLPALESLVAGIALAADNLAPSFFLGWAGLIRQSTLISSIVLGSLTAVFSIVAVTLGQNFGKKLTSFFGRIPPELASGSLIIAIALIDPEDIIALLVGH